MISRSVLPAITICCQLCKDNRFMISRSVLPAVEQHIGTLTYHVILADLADSTIVELVPLFVEEVLAVCGVVTRAQTAVVVDHAVEIVHDWSFAFIG